MEKDVGVMDDKLDLIIKNMKTYSHYDEQSESDKIVEEWSKDIAEAWEEARPHSRPKRKTTKTTKTTKPRNKPRSPSSSSSALSIEDLQEEGETKKYGRKRFYPKDHKFKRSSEIVHVHVKTLEKRSSN